MGKEDNTAKWLYAGVATFCVTGVAVFAITTGTPIVVAAGLDSAYVKVATGTAAMAVATGPSNDRSKN